jgi:hypothetical protein
MARLGLGDLFEYVRKLTYAGTADYTLGTINFWDDDQVEEILDRHRKDVYTEQLGQFPRSVGGGTLEYYEFRSRYGHFEKTDGGTAVFVVEDSLGADSASADYAVDYVKGVVTFTPDQAGSARFLTGRYYDVYGAAAELLRSWATKEKLEFTFSTDGQSFQRRQKAEMLMQMAAEYEQQAWPVTMTQVRTDLSGV